MTVKKEYVFLAVIIVALGLYVAFRETDRTRYELPTLPAISAKTIDKIELAGPEGPVLLEKKDGRWRLLPGGYPADDAKVDRVLDAIDELTLTTLVSESGEVARYELDDARKVLLKAWEGDTLKRQIDIGKVAGTFRHTHIRLPDDPKVYHAEGDFRSVVDKPLADFRDLQVMSFDKTAATSLDIEANGNALRLSVAVVPPEPTEGTAMEDPEEKGSEKTPDTRTVWKSEDGTEAAIEPVAGILDFMADLKADGYRSETDKGSQGEPDIRITVEADKTYTLSVFPKASTEDAGLPALSSDSQYPFNLSQFDVDSLKKHIDALIPPPANQPDAVDPSDPQ
ncbi:MAG: DUF4340 domain-containing protein [Desulfobacterales bacterium]|jgi:hypothetical protein